MKHLYLLSILICTVLFGYSQQQLVNMDFENWTTYTVGVDSNGADPNQDQYPRIIDSLEGGIWGSGNTLIDTLDEAEIKNFLKDTTYSYSGNKAALMRTQTIGPAIATGTLWTGYIAKIFDLNASLFGAKTGVPFSGTPSSIIGHYDYLSKQGDSCLIECHVTHWNSATQHRDTIGSGQFFTDQTSNGFEPFEAEIIYNTPNPTVDTVILVMLSSYGGLEYRGKEGSTLIVDSTAFKYDSIIVSTNNLRKKLPLKAYANDGQVILNAGGNLKNCSINIYNTRGQLLYSDQISNMKEKKKIEISPNQIVIIEVTNGEKHFREKIFVTP